MTNQHPITPPPELVDKWEEEWHHFHFKHSDVDLSLYVAAYAAQWGANQELEACEQAIIDRKWFADPEFRLAELHNARRPKPPSLKEQALESLHHLEAGCEPNIDLLRRALEALPE